MLLDCIILAAGGSKRFGSCKLLASRHGVPLIENIINVARSLNPPLHIKIITGAYHTSLNRFITLGKFNQDKQIRCFQCIDWSAGLSKSIAFGVNQFQTENGLLILLADQPKINTNDLQNLITFWRSSPEKIACAQFSDTLGVPAIFPSSFKKELSQLQGDSGAKVLLNKYKASLNSIFIPNAAFDVDTPENLDQY